MHLSLLRESDWKLDTIESFGEVSQNNMSGYMRDGRDIKKGDNMEWITYLACAPNLTMRVELTINSTTGTALIDWLGRGPNRHDKTWPGPGYTNLRKLLSQISKLHPSIKRFTGYRIGGMREKYQNDQSNFSISVDRL